jgi:hypothetical protein
LTGHGACPHDTVREIFPSETELFVARDAHDEHAADANQKKSKKGLIALLLAVVSAAVAVFAKKKHDQDLDESLWDEPRSL